MKKREVFLRLALMMLAVVVGFVSGGAFAMADAAALGGQGNTQLGEGVTVDGVVTVEGAEGLSPELIRKHIDDMVTKCRPNNYPIDQISRFGQKKLVKARVVEFYSVDQKSVASSLSGAWTEPGASVSTDVATISVSNPDIFLPNDTIKVKGVKGFEVKNNIEQVSLKDLVLFVLGPVSGDPSKLRVKAVNGKTITNTGTQKQFKCVPSIPTGTKILRMGPAFNELAVKAKAQGVLPLKRSNKQQTFIMQTEMGKTFAKTLKEVNWTLSDEEEYLMADFRRAQEFSLVLGAESIVKDEEGRDVYFTEGTWYQADNDFTYDPNAEFSNGTLIDMLEKVFTGNNSSGRKCMFSGKTLLSRISKIEVNKQILGKETKVVFGLEFEEIRTVFGTILVKWDEAFDQAGMSDCGLVLDPDYIVRYEFDPFEKTHYDLKELLESNADASVMKETCCLCLKNPKGHTRVYPTTGW